MRLNPNHPAMPDEQLRGALGELCREDLAPPLKLKMFRQLRELGPDAAERLDAAVISRLAELYAALRESGGHLEQLRARIEELSAPPYFAARCYSVAESERGVEAWVSFGGQVRVVPVDQKVPRESLSTGDDVLLSSTLNRVLAAVPGVMPVHGETAVLERAASGGLLVNVRGDVRTVIPVKTLLNQPLQKGDLIQLDSSGMFALGVVPGSTGEEYLVQDASSLASFDHIGGLDAEIRRIKDLILLQARHPDVSERYGLARENTILLAGKTGSGKTMLAQATCRFLGELTGGGGRFMFVGPGDLQDMWYGQTQKHIKNLFAAAHAAAERDPSPLVVFFDEVDAYLGKRSSVSSSRVHNEVTAALLSEMDGFRKHANVWLMAATNRLHDLDSAGVRGARFGNNIITFSALRRAGAREIFRKHLPSSLPFREGGVAEIIDSVVAVLYAPNGDNRIADIQFRDGSKRAVTAADGMLSGSEIAKICRLAKERAALREIELGEPGIRREDLLLGVERFIGDSAAKLKPHNCHDYIDLPDDMDVVKVEPARRLRVARARVA
jgi:ATP-dependent 26S proteasome regulatory subunit